MANWIEGTVTENHVWTENLFSLKVAWPAQEFIAGQYVRLGLELGEKRVQRAYSLVNPPNSEIAEFYLTRVPDGQLSSALAKLQVGDTVSISTPPNGFFTLSEVPDGDNLWLLSTGTGIGPFLSILATAEPWQRFKKIVLVHGVRWQRDLTYQPMIEQWQQQYPQQLSYVQVVSRESSADTLTGRIPELIEQQQLQQKSGQPINAASQVMICGNPQMIKDTRAVLEQLGLSKNLRRKPGQITVEQYW